MPRPLLTVFAAPGSPLVRLPGVQTIALDGRDAASLDRALPAALAPVAIRLAAGERLGPGAAEAAAETAGRQPHRSWWWAAEDAAAGRPHADRTDLLTLLMRHGRPLPVTLFRPKSVRDRGGFGSHPGPAWAYADACARLADGLHPGRIRGPLLRVRPGHLGDDAAAAFDRANVASAFADRCDPPARDAVWAACSLTRRGQAAPPPVAGLRRTAA